MDKIRTGQYFIDKKAKQLTFLDSRFYTEDEVNFYPSVTTYLDAYPKTAQFYEWLKKAGEDSDNIRDEAGERGSIVHNLAEAYDNGETIRLTDDNDKILYKTSEWKMFERYVEFSKLVKPQILRNEYRIVSPTIKAGGTIDRNIIIDFKKVKGRFIIDLKTGNGIWGSEWLQLAAYKEMHDERFPDEPIDGYALLWLNAKTRTDGGKTDSIQGKGWQLLLPPQSHEHYWNVFKATQLLWNEVHGDMKPNFTSYTIEHKRNETSLPLIDEANEKTALTLGL